MRRIQDFKGYSSLFENIQAAKDLVLSVQAQKLKKKVSDLTPEESKEVLSSPMFFQVKKLSEPFPALAALFAAFLFKQDITLQKARELSAKMQKMQKDLDQLPIKISQYGKVVPDDSDTRPGWERLETDLDSLADRLLLRQLYQDFRPAMKEQFNKASEEEKNKMAQAAKLLFALPDKEGVDEDGNAITRNAVNEFISQQKKYIDTKTYPNFVDPRVAFLSLMDDMDIKIETWTESEAIIRERIAECGVAAKILYDSGGYLAVSCRQHTAVVAVAGNTNWCIKNSSTFWTYSNGGVQYCFINFNLRSTDRWFLVGLTILADGTVKDSADQPNQAFAPRGKNYLDVLRWKLDFPDTMLNALDRTFDTEVRFKKMMDKFFGPKSTGKFIEEIFAMGAGTTSASPERLTLWSELSELIAEFQHEELEKVITAFATYGILSELSLSLFSDVFCKYCTPDDLKKIYSASVEAYKEAKEIAELETSGQLDPQYDYLINSAKQTLEIENEALKFFEGKGIGGPSAEQEIA